MIHGNKDNVFASKTTMKMATSNANIEALQSWRDSSRSIDMLYIAKATVHRQPFREPSHIYKVHYQFFSCIPYLEK